MFPLIVSTAAIVLHSGHSVTLEQYLFRVFVYLLTFACIGVTLFWGTRVVGTVHSKVGKWGTNKNER